MQVRSLLLTAGVGMAAGAAAVLMLPKHSDAYRMANNAAQTIKQEAGKMIDQIRKD
jgi:gas vesicle protein